MTRRLIDSSLILALGIYIWTLTGATAAAVAVTMAGAYTLIWDLVHLSMRELDS
jgi:hypothetical protein